MAYKTKDKKKQNTWSGGRTFGSSKLPAITREQQETRVLLVAGRGARGWGLRKAILIKLLAMEGCGGGEKKNQPLLCEIIARSIVQG